VAALLLILAGASAFALGCGSSSGASGSGSGGASGGGSGSIKVGVLQDQTGSFATVGLQQLHAAQLAVDDINTSGGLLGRKLEIIAPDAQSDIQRYQEMARKLILGDNVDVLVGGYTSASREAVRPVVDQFKKLYIYNTQYEGGVADHYVICTGATPEAQWQTELPWMIKKFGGRIYTIAADYNFGQISAQWVRKIAAANGGQVIGEEFIPLDNSSYSATIQRIQAAKPDFVVVMMVGQKQASFFPQWGASGMAGKIPMASSIALAQGYEHLQFKPPAVAEMYATATFMQELPTSAAKAFVAKWHQKWPNEPYVGMEAEATYTGVHLWAEAVKKANAVDTESVIKAFETGTVSYDAPSGKVTIDAKTHAAIRDIWLAHANMQQKIDFPTMWKQVVPSWLSKVKGVDLPNKPEMTQYTP